MSCCNISFWIETFWSESATCCHTYETNCNRLSLTAVRACCSDLTTFCCFRCTLLIYTKRSCIHAFFENSRTAKARDIRCCARPKTLFGSQRRIRRCDCSFPFCDRHQHYWQNLQCAHDQSPWNTASGFWHCASHLNFELTLIVHARYRRVHAKHVQTDLDTQCNSHAWALLDSHVLACLSRDWQHTLVACILSEMHTKTIANCWDQNIKM